MTESVHTILVVDDDPAVSTVLLALLRQAGFHTLQAASGAEALECLNRSDIDAVVTDVRMPGMDGLQLLAKCRTRWPDIPVLVITAHGTVAQAVEAIKAGATDFILKP